MRSTTAAGQILPVLGLVEAVERGVGAASTDFDTAVILDRDLVRRVRRQRSLWIDVGKQDRVVQVRMVLLHAQHVMRATLAERAGDLRLGAHRVDRHHAALDRQLGEQFGNRSDLVRLLGDRRLAQHDAHAGRERADQVQRTGVRLALAAAWADRALRAWMSRKSAPHSPFSKGVVSDVDAIAVSMRIHCVRVAIRPGDIVVANGNGAWFCRQASLPTSW